MKKFDKIILQTIYTNIYGETMTLILDGELKSWFSHTDCNDDFESIDNGFFLKANDIVSEETKKDKTIQKVLNKIGNNPVLKYVLSDSESATFYGFLDSAAAIKKRLNN